MSLRIKDNELKELLDEVATDLAKAFESEKEKLVKAESSKEESKSPEMTPEESSAKKAEMSASSSEGSLAKEATPPHEETPGEDHAPEGSASLSGPEGLPEASESSLPPGGEAPPEEAQPELTPEALQAEYAKLPPEELEMHLQAAMAAKAALAQPAPDASAPMAPPSAPPDMAMKKELPPSPEHKANQGLELHKKHETEIAELKTLIKSQQEDTENLVKVFKRMLEQPQRKAVTSVAHIAKTEEKRVITAESIRSRLNELTRTPDLKKSDRQLINDFYDGRASADKLAHLFEDYK